MSKPRFPEHKNNRVKGMMVLNISFADAAACVFGTMCLSLIACVNADCRIKRSAIIASKVSHREIGYAVDKLGGEKAPVPASFVPHGSIRQEASGVRSRTLYTAKR